MTGLKLMYFSNSMDFQIVSPQEISDFIEIAPAKYTKLPDLSEEPMGKHLCFTGNPLGFSEIQFSLSFQQLLMTKDDLPGNVTPYVLVYSVQCAKLHVIFE